LTKKKIDFGAYCYYCYCCKVAVDVVGDDLVAFGSIGFCFVVHVLAVEHFVAAAAPGVIVGVADMNVNDVMESVAPHPHYF